MPGKPSRPIEMMYWTESGKRRIRRTEFSSDQKELEREWASRFVELWNGKAGSEPLEVDPSLDFGEPADLLLRAGDGRLVGLQVTEAVDERRNRRHRFRQYVQKHLFSTSDEDGRNLVNALSGMQVVLMERTTTDIPPEHSRKFRRHAVKNIRAALWSSVRKSPLFPVELDRWDKHELIEFTAVDGVRMWLHAVRYATANLGRPLKVFWSVGCAEMEDRPPRFFKEATLGKLDVHYTPGANELWLLVYSVDCPLALDEEADIRALLQSRPDNPFARIFALPDAGRPVQIYPPIDNASHLGAKTPKLVMYSTDSLPTLDDERWVYFPTS